MKYLYSLRVKKILHLQIELHMLLLLIRILSLLWLMECYSEWICTILSIALVSELLNLYWKIFLLFWFLEIPLTKYTNTCRLTNLFLDPTGNHLLLTFAQKTPEGGPELLYLSKKSDKLRSTTKFRGNEFTEIAWNMMNESESTTGPILLGRYFSLYNVILII